MLGVAAEGRWFIQRLLPMLDISLLKWSVEKPDFSGSSLALHMGFDESKREIRAIALLTLKVIDSAPG